jgi:hypothetical protein
MLHIATNPADLSEDQFGPLRAIVNTWVNASQEVASANLAASCTVLQAVRRDTPNMLSVPATPQKAGDTRDLPATVAEVLSTYSQKLVEIANDCNAQWLQILEAQVGQSNDRLCELVGLALQGAPLGSHVPVLFLKNAFAAQRLVIEALSKSAAPAPQRPAPRRRGTVIGTDARK